MRIQTLLLRTFVSAALLILSLSPVSFAQQATGTGDLLNQANTLMQQEKWKEAAAAYEKVLKADSLNAQAAFQGGQAYYMAADYRKAVAMWERADSRNFRLSTTRYNIALAYAQLRDREKAFSWLAQAIESGFNRVDILQSDNVLDSLRADERFAKVVQLADQNARPCEYEPTYRILDFWLGEWEVFINENQKIGESYIRKLVNGCAMQESFAQLDGFLGENFFYYNNITGEWKMVWVTGTAVLLGGVKERVLTSRDDSGALHFIGELPGNIPGQVILDRTTVIPASADRINIIVEQSRDSGANWVTTFSGSYQRMKAKPGSEKK